MLTLLAVADYAMTLGNSGRGRHEPALFDFRVRAHTAFTCLEWRLPGRAIALGSRRCRHNVRGRHTELRSERIALLAED